jgi:hypothetical protein
MLKRRKEPDREAAQLPRVVLIDANVFFAPRMRDLVMHLHAAELINVHWTKEIEAEWTRNVVVDKERYVAVLVTHGCARLAQGLAHTWGVECPQMARDGTLYYESERKRTKSIKKAARRS